ncbi:MAG: iron complex outermembrane receptor protein [Saprospiraceae bacterium]|jgi:iron complex outermembrane receptor protein
MKRILLLISMLLMSNGVFSQKATINGTVTDDAGIALQFINVAIEGTTYGGSTDDQGRYTISNIPAGDITLVASAVGYRSSMRQMRIAEGQKLNYDFVLMVGGVALQMVEVIGRKAITYDTEESFGATKTATAIKDVPQAISYVTKEVMSDRQAYTVNDVVKNLSGINQFSYYNDYTIRGFRSQQEMINGLRVIGLFGPQILSSNLERVEVIKGPASAVSGNGSPGGTMNRVTKKPLDEERKALNFTTGSFNRLRATLDFTGPLNKEKTLLYRLNLAYENSNDFRDLQERKSFMVAPSISFLPTDKTSVNFDLVLTNFDGKLDRGQPIFGASAGTDLTSTPVSFAIGAANDYHKTDVAYSTLSLNHQFSPNFSFNSSYMRYSYNEDLFEHRTSNRFAVDAEGNQLPTLMGMRISAREQRRSTDNVTNYFAWDTNTGSIGNIILVGYDYIQQTRPVGSATVFTSSGAIYRTVDGGVATYNPATPKNYIFENGQPKPNIPHFDLENPAYVIGFESNYILSSRELSPTRFYTNGIYIQDQIKWKNLQVLVGLRQEYYNDVTNYKNEDEVAVQQNKLLPRLGLVYSISKSINLYATGTQSFQPQNPSRLDEASGGPFDPMTGQMFEVGAKGSFFKNRLSANLAVYNIDNKNILIRDPQTGLFVQRGAERSRGFELDVNGRIGANLSITANYAHNKATIEEDDNEELIGLQKENAPLHAGGFFINYAFQEKLDGLNFNFGADFVSERNTFEQELQLPSYTIFDAGISYRMNKVKIALTFNNLFDKTHWTGGYSYVRLFPGAPRNYLLSIGYTF